MVLVATGVLIVFIFFVLALMCIRGLDSSTPTFGPVYAKHEHHWADNISGTWHCAFCDATSTNPKGDKLDG